MAALSPTPQPTPLGGRAWVGVDLADDQAIACRATRKRGGVTFTPAAQTPDARTPVIAALPAHTAFLRRLRAPFASVAKAEKVWPSLLDIELPFPLDAAIFTFLRPVRTDDGQVETIAVAARREDVAAWHERLQRADCAVWRLDHEGLALWSFSATETPLPRDTHRMVCYVGPDRTALAWGRGSDVLAASGLRVGARDLFDPERGDAARRSWAQRAGQFLRAQNAPADATLQWAWCGPGLRRPDQVALLAASLGLPPGATVFTHREPETFLARALGARAVRPDTTACTLLPEDRTPPALQRILLQQARRGPLALAAAALLLLGVNVGWLAWLEHRRVEVHAALHHLAVDLSGNPGVPRGQEVLVTERALNEQAPGLQPFRNAFAPSLQNTLGLLLGEAAKRKLQLTTLTLSDQNLVCSGSAADWNQGESLAEGLQQAGWLTEVEKREAAAEERVAFTLKASR
jgi:hypothetical protein